MDAATQPHPLAWEPGLREHVEELLEVLLQVNAHVIEQRGDQADHTQRTEQGQQDAQLRSSYDILCKHQP